MYTFYIHALPPFAYVPMLCNIKPTPIHIVDICEYSLIFGMFIWYVSIYKPIHFLFLTHIFCLFGVWFVLVNTIWCLVIRAELRVVRGLADFSYNLASHRWQCLVTSDACQHLLNDKCRKSTGNVKHPRIPAQSSCPR